MHQMCGGILGGSTVLKHGIPQRTSAEFDSARNLRVGSNVWGKILLWGARGWLAIGI